MSRKIIAYDLGTGGNKASLYDADGECLGSVFVPYETHYPRPGWHEQRPLDWWDAVVASTRRLLDVAACDGRDIGSLAISGHSLGVVPIDRCGNLLRATMPIWSDTRAHEQVERFFESVDEEEWYLTTGNGFPPPCYAAFKVMWYRDNEPDMFRQIHKVIGTKDFINYRLTGQIKTDYSYASGSGVYDLRAWAYSPKLMGASGIPDEIWPDIVDSTYVLGELTGEAADCLGLPKTVQVVCGGVDNACMAAGARCISEGRAYTSLGSSAWIAVSSGIPILDAGSRPYVFTHVVPGMFTSALSIFSAGTSHRWVRDNVCSNLVAAAEAEGRDPYAMMDELAAQSPVGTNGLIFNPSLAGGTCLDPSFSIRGAYLGIDLSHSQADLIRAALEGISLNLRLVLDELSRFCELSDEMVLVGGGSKSKLWRQIFADTFNRRILRTNVGQEAAALGAAAVAAVGSGIWRDFSRIDEIHRIEAVGEPIAENVPKYEALLPVFDYARTAQSKIGDMLRELSV